MVSKPNELARCTGFLRQRLPRTDLMSGTIRPFDVATWDAFELFEQYGLTTAGQVGKHAWILSRVVDPVLSARCPASTRWLGGGLMPG
jgi:hypothetical protein